MKSKTAIALFALITFSSTVFAQRMVTKTNILFGPVFKSIRTIQEVKTGPRTTTQTTVKVSPTSPLAFGHIGSVYVFGNRCNGLIYPKLGAGGNITEFRIYSKKKGAMHGFYFGPYSSVSFISVTSDQIPVNFTDPKNEAVYSATLIETYKIYLAGGGFQIGVQSMKKRFCVDWTILAIGFGKLGIKGTIDATNTSPNFDFNTIMSDNPDNIRFGVEKNLNITKTIWSTELSFDKHVPCPMIRMGLSIGFGYLMTPKIKKPEMPDQGTKPDQQQNQQSNPQPDQKTNQQPQPTTDQVQKQADEMKKQADQEAEKAKEAQPTTEQAQKQAEELKKKADQEAEKAKEEEKKKEEEQKKEQEKKTDKDGNPK
jgi:hypothetical protein